MSTAKFDTLQNAAGTKSVPVGTVVDGSAKAWVNFNGTGTVAIRASFNVTSIADTGVGQYTVNFTTAMSDANYSVTGTAGTAAASGAYATVSVMNSAPSSSAAPIRTTDQAAALTDFAWISVVIFR